MTQTVTFLSGNKGKWNQIQQEFASYKHLDFTLSLNDTIDLEEIQGTAEEIIKKKCLEAFDILKVPVLVEDTSLYFNALDGLPGPYIKHFHKSLGLDGLVKILSEFEDKSAQALCLFGYYDKDMTEPEIFRGVVDGSIVKPVVVKEYFGWDPIFKPDTFEKTFAEMTIEDKNKISHRGKAFRNFVEWKTSKPAK